MEILRFPAALMLAAACAVCGQERVKGMKKRMVEQELWQQKLLLLKGEIQYGHTSLPELFSYLGKDQKYRVDQFFLSLSRRLKKEQLPFYTVWRREVEDLAKELDISMEPLILVGQQLGSVNRQTELKNLELYMQQYERELAQKRERFREQKKVVRAVSISFGLALMLLLI